MGVLKIKPDGVVKDGAILINIQSTGEVEIRLKVVAHYLLTDHESDHCWQTKVDPNLVKSKNLQKHQSIKVGDFRFNIMNITGNVAIANVFAFIAGQLAHGTATIHLDQELIQITRLTAEFTFMGQSIKLETV